MTLDIVNMSPGNLTTELDSGQAGAGGAFFVKNTSTGADAGASIVATCENLAPPLASDSIRTAVYGKSSSGCGVIGESSASFGVYGTSFGAGVGGESLSSYGGQFRSLTTAQGVIGATQSTGAVPTAEAIGVHGIASSGVGVRGEVTGTSGIPMVARGASGQTARLQEWQKNDGTVLSAVDANGNFVLGHSGTNSGAFMAKDIGGTARNIMFIGGDNNVYMVNDIPNSLYVVQVAATSRAQFGNPLWLSARGNYQDFFMTSGGNVGIGTSGPGYRLDVAGQVHATGFPTSSDLRFKEDITPVDNALDKVLRLNGVYFKWNQLHREVLKRSNTKTRQVGLIAQQVREVVPEIVSEWADQGAEDYLAVDYNRLVAIMIEAMKEQQTQITEQQSTIEQLLRRIANLEGNNETVHTH
jgi:hypothetical protein